MRVGEEGRGRGEGKRGGKEEELGEEEVDMKRG